MKNRFVKNVLTLMTGTTLAQAIPLLASLLLFRLYTPEEFGVFALYVSITSIITVMVTAQYESAIVLPEREEEAWNIAALCIVITTLFAGSCYVLIAMIQLFFSQMLSNIALSKWLWFIPVTVFFTGIYQTCSYWCNRKENYKLLGGSRALQSLLVAGSNIALGLMGVGEAGLVIGGIAGQACATVLLSWQIWKSENEKNKEVSWLTIREVAYRYRNFPKHMMGANFISVIHQQIPTFFIERMFSTTAVGYYSTAVRFISLPSTLISKAIGDVFRQKAAEQYRQTGEFRSLLLQTVKVTCLLAVIPYAVLCLFSPDIFALAFGENWREAGTYAAVISIAAFFSFVITPIDKFSIVVQATRYAFSWQLSMLLCNVLLATVIYMGKFDIMVYLYVHGAIRIVHYFIDLTVGWRMSKGKNTVRGIEHEM